MLYVMHQNGQNEQHVGRLAQPFPSARRPNSAPKLLHLLDGSAARVRRYRVPTVTPQLGPNSEESAVNSISGCGGEDIQRSRYDEYANKNRELDYLTALGHNF